MGFLRPRLLLPSHVLSDFAPNELRLITLHELAHLKRHDVAINWLLALLQALHWFNPVLWLAFARLRNDRELAADEMVLALTTQPDRECYGQTIVKLLQSLSRRPVLAGSVGTVGILERAHPLRRRITMIAQFTAPNRRWTLAAATCMLALAALALTDAVRGDAPTEKTAPATQPATKPTFESPAQAMAHAAADRMTGTSTKEIADAKQQLAADITNKQLVINANGSPENEAAVREQIAQAQDYLDKILVNRAASKEYNATIASGTVPASQPTAVDQTDAEKVYAQFQRKIPEVRMESIPAGDVIDFLRDVTSMNIEVGWKALEDAGIDRNTPITMRVHDVRLEQVLRQFCRQLGGGQGGTIGFTTDGGGVVISTIDDLTKSARTRAYDVRDLLDDAQKPGRASTRPAREDLVELVTQNVAPDSWREAGGQLGVIKEFDGRLVVTTIDMYHLDVERLLAELRKR
jgi:hypothetical protein